MQDFFADIDWSGWLETIWTTTARVALIIIVVVVVVQILKRLLRPAITATVVASMPGEPRSEVDKRTDTLFSVIYGAITVVGVTVALLTILPQFGVNVTALIAGAGVAGLAISIGSQNLVKDIIGGLFIVLENQYGEGDVIKVAGVSGQVENVNLRRTLLRDLDGAVHTVPNGQITVASNLTRFRSRVNTLVSVSPQEDPDRVFELINRTGQELADDPAWAKDIIEAPHALGIELFSDAKMDVRVLGDTPPSRQWDVSREFLKRLKHTFESEGITLA
jgi:small conductance mechanosensitive channel